MLGENLTNAEICPQNLGGTERQLRNSDLSMTYWIMLAGFCTSVVIFVTEVSNRLFVSNRVRYNHVRFNFICISQIIFRFLNNRFSSDHIKMRSTFGKRFNTKSTISNVTPPPAYASLFNRNKIFTTDQYVKSFDMNGGVKQVINGRNYMVFRNNDGEPRLVPLRTPSAALFQYTYMKWSAWKMFTPSTPGKSSCLLIRNLL